MNSTTRRILPLLSLVLPLAALLPAPALPAAAAPVGAVAPQAPAQGQDQVEGQAPGAAQAAPGAAGVSDQDREDIARVQAYMQGITTLTAKFTQVDQSYGRSTGQLWLHRPGRLRFEYDPPVPYLIIANGDFLVQYDKDLEAATYVPQSSTPAWFLLAPKISLEGDVTVTRVERRPGLLALTLVQTKSPDDGSVTLEFAEDPLRLERWTVVDAQGGVTRVALHDVEAGQPIPSSKFAFNDPALSPERNRNRP